MHIYDGFMYFEWFYLAKLLLQIICTLSDFLIRLILFSPCKVGALYINVWDSCSILSPIFETFLSLIWTYSKLIYKNMNNTWIYWNFPKEFGKIGYNILDGCQRWLFDWLKWIFINFYVDLEAPVLWIRCFLRMVRSSVHVFHIILVRNDLLPWTVLYLFGLDN